MGPLPFLVGTMIVGLVAGRWMDVPSWAPAVLSAASLVACALLTWKGCRASWWLAFLASLLLGGFLGGRAGKGGSPEALPPLPSSSVLELTALADASNSEDRTRLRVKVEGGRASFEEQSDLERVLKSMRERDPCMRANLSINHGTCRVREGDRFLVRTARFAPRRGHLNPGVESRASKGSPLLLLASDCGQLVQLDRHRPVLAAARSALAGRQRRDLHPLVAGLASAVTTGSQDEVDRGMKEMFRRSGTSHLLAISGLHLALMSLVSFGSVRFLWGRFSRLTSLVPAQHAAAVAALATAWGFALFASARAPVMRAAIMVTAALAARVCGRSTSAATPMSLAAAGILVASPHEIAGASFLLSFSAVTGILLGVPRMVALFPGWLSGKARGIAGRIARWIANLAVVSMSATLGTLPPTMAIFGAVPVVGPFANILVVPLFCFVTLPAIMLHVACSTIHHVLGTIVAPLVLAATWPLVLVLRCFSAAPVIPLAVGMEMVTAVVAGVGLVLALARRRIEAMALAGIVTAMVLLPGPFQRWMRDAEIEDRLVVVFLDVGQGDAAYIRTPGGRHLLVDTGPSHPRAGSEAPLPEFLRAWGVQSLDAVVVSHAHSDHYGGLDDLMAAGIEIRHLYPGVADRDPSAEPGYHPVMEAVRDRGTVIHQPPGCGPLVGLGLDAEVIHPCGSREGLDANDRSIVLSLCHGQMCFLFTGDVGKLVASRVASGERARRTRVLKFPHHGSAGSASRAMCSMPLLRDAVLSSKQGNSHGFPHPEALACLSRAGVRPLRIDTGGGWLLVTDGLSLLGRASGLGTSEASENRADRPGSFVDLDDAMIPDLPPYLPQ